MDFNQLFNQNLFSTFDFGGNYNMDQAKSYGSKKGSAIGGAGGALLGPVGAAVGSLAGGLIGGALAKKKASSVLGERSAKRDTLTSMNKEIAQQNNLNLAKKSSQAYIDSKLKRNLI